MDEAKKALSPTGKQRVVAVILAYLSGAILVKSLSFVAYDAPELLLRHFPHLFLTDTTDTFRLIGDIANTLKIVSIYLMYKVYKLSIRHQQKQTGVQENESS